MPKSKKEDDSTKKSSVTKKSQSKKTATKTAAKKTATKTAAKKTTTKTAAKKSATKPEKSLTKKVEVSDDGFNWTEFGKEYKQFPKNKLMSLINSLMKILLIHIPKV